MWEFLETLSNSSFAVWVRDAPTIFAYSTVLALHTFGMSFLVGLSSMIALRVLGCASGLPLAPMKKFLVLIVIGFWLNAATGVVLLILAPREFLTNPDFYIKLAAIAGAVVSLQLLRKAVFGISADVGPGSAPMKAKVFASMMLIFWGLAITAGRLTAYSGLIMRWTAVAVVIVASVVFIGRYVGARLLESYRPARLSTVTTSTEYSQTRF
jgi:hypothetical protein